MTSSPLSVAPATASAPTASGPSAAGRRYADELARLHRRLRWGGLVDAIDGDPLVRLDDLGDGLTTVAVRTNQLPERYLRALYGFRLAEFLQTGLMDADLALAKGLAHEALPSDEGALQSVHIATIDTDGAIVGYACLAKSPDPAPLALDDPSRRPFPVEEAHDVDVVTRYAQPGRTTHDVYEIKRLIRRGGLPRGMARSRVPWHLVVGLNRSGLAMGDACQVVVGDSGERGALRHIGLLGFDLLVVNGTTPRIAKDQLMWPSYELPADVRAKPFAAEVVPEPLAAHTDVVVDALRTYHGDDWQQHTGQRLLELIAERGTRLEPRTEQWVPRTFAEAA